MRKKDHDHLEPTPDEGAVAAPAHLSPAARAIWDELAPELQRKALLAPRYAILFEVFCASVDQARKALRILDATGPLVAGRHESLVANPAGRTYREFARLAVITGSEFGMSPAATSSMARHGYEDMLRPAVGDDPASYLT